MTKKSGKKEKGTSKRKNKQEKAHLQSTIQLVVVSLYTIYKVSTFNGCGDIFDEKFGKKEKETNKRKNK